MRIALIIVCLFPFSLFAQQPDRVEGTWRGAISISGQELGFSVTFANNEGVLDGTLDIPAQNAFNLPVDVPLFTADSLVFQFSTGTGPAVFRAALNGGANGVIGGQFEQVGAAFPFEMRRSGFGAARESRPLAEEELLIELGSHRIAGSLVHPENNDTETLIVLISGSGLQNRNSTVAGFNLFLELATVLADAGYHSFRFDDRTVGRSTGNPDATLQELSRDVEGVVDFLLEYSDSYSRILLLGHSQGGLVATLAAQNVPVNGLLLVASPALTADQIINQQIQALSQSQGIPDAVVQENLAFQRRIYDAVLSGENWTDIERDLEDRLREQMNTLPAPQREALGDMNAFIASQIERQLAASKTRWFRSFIQFEPISELKQTPPVPVLAIYGEKDMQVQALPNVEQLGNHEWERPLETAIIPEANHLFQTANTGMPGEYGMLEPAFADGFIAEILSWLQSLE